MRFRTFEIPPVSDAVLPSHREIRAEIDRLGLGLDASELHGSLCGYLCGGGQAEPRGWLDRLAIAEGAHGAHGEDSALERMFRISAEQLNDPDFGFELLLPDEDASLGQRADALLAWCRGFLGGFGLASGANPPLSAEAGEALDDLGRIAASQLSYDDPEADEDALAEIAEFVRVAAMLLHGDCVLGPRHRQRLH